eukprot:GFUD01016653.1.p1 GENE.GFUD01016653.1~~GFUD01016653.1.p1  ORF type:complete len:482 (+),score=112.50 GFUD01016653.1:255-1700(+)
MGAAAPDGGFWGWVAVFACFMGNVIGDGVMYSFGIFMPKFKEHFHCGSGEIATVNAIQMGVTFASGPLASLLTNRLGWRLTTVIGSVLASAGFALSAVVPNVFCLYMTAGVLIGLGLGIIYLPRVDCITQYFDKKRPFVTGIAICGSGIGTFLFAPLTEWLLEHTNWKIALLILSGICLINCGFALLFKPLPVCQEKEKDVCEVMLDHEEDDKDKSVNKDTFKEMNLLLRNWVFMVFAASNFLTSLGYPIPYTFVPDNARQTGLTGGQGSFLVGLIGISNTVARLLLGIASQKLHRLYLYNTCLVICGLAMALTNFFQPISAAMFSYDCTQFLTNPTSSPAFNSTAEMLSAVDVNNSTGLLSLPWACDPYVGQLMYAILYGVTSAAYVLLTTLVLADLLGADKFTNAFGLLLLFQGVATFIGPPIVGFMFDAFGTYNEGFILMGSMISLSGLMLYPVPCIMTMLATKDKQPEEMELLEEPS